MWGVECGRGWGGGGRGGGVVDGGGWFELLDGVAKGELGDEGW